MNLSCLLTFPILLFAGGLPLTAHAENSQPTACEHAVTMPPIVSGPELKKRLSSQFKPKVAAGKEVRSLSFVLM